MKQLSRILAATLLVPALASDVLAQDAEAPAAVETPTAVEPSAQPVEVASEAGVTEEADVLPESDDAASKKNWAVSVGLTTAIGQGTFVSVSNDSGLDVGDADEAYDRVNMVLSLVPSYNIADIVSVSASFAMVQWLTTGGGINEPGEFRFQDIGLGIDWAGHTIESANLSFGAGLSFGLPTSALSKATSLYVSTGIYGSVGWTLFQKLRLGYSLSLGKDFHEFTSPVIEDEIAGADNVIWRAGGSERVSDGLTAIEGVNTEYSLSNSFSAGFAIWDKLRLSVSYVLTTFWAYDVFEEDEFTSPLADPGRGVGQSTRTDIVLSYPVHKYLNVSLGARTSVQPKTDDNRTFNFPFWNVDGAAANSSQIRIGLSSSF